LEVSQNFINKMNALIACNPERCGLCGCPLYYEEMKKCDAERFIQTFTTVMHTKLENTVCYQPGENISETAENVE